MSSGPLILVVDDDGTTRRSLRILLERADYQVQEYASAEFCLIDTPSDGKCLITAIRMSGMDGLALQIELSRRGIAIPVILTTGHGDVALAVNGMKAGAVDVIVKPFDSSILLGSVERALMLGSRIDSATAIRSSASGKLALLTRRERDVFNKIVSGLSNKVAAHELGISPRTIEVHRGHIMKKMNAQSLADLTRISCAAPNLACETSGAEMGGHENPIRTALAKGDGYVVSAPRLGVRVAHHARHA